MTKKNDDTKEIPIVEPATPAAEMEDPDAELYEPSGKPLGTITTGSINLPPAPDPGGRGPRRVEARTTMDPTKPVILKEGESRHAAAQPEKGRKAPK